MSKHRYFSKDFFVDASEAETRQSIMDIPAFVNNIKFVHESSISSSLRFLYEHSNDTPLRYVDVSVLPLNGNQSRVRLHVTYANSRRFHNDNTIITTMQNFESAVLASIDGTLLDFTPKEFKVNAAKKLGHNAMMAMASLGLFFLWKKVA